MDTDFSKITPCGGNCSDCKHFIDSDCLGEWNSGGVEKQKRLADE